jgi:hypothetical protein
MLAVLRDPRGLGRWFRLEQAAWATPVVVLLLGMALPQLRLHQLIAATAGVLLLAALSRHPGPVACALVVGFPVAEIVLPLALRSGLPPVIVRAAGSWKELLVAALVVAAVRHRRTHPSTPDRLDLLGVGFLAVLALYWLFPTWLASTDLIIPGDAKDVAARTLGLPVVGLLAARHVDLDDRWRGRVTTWAVVAGVIIGGCAVVEILRPSTWQTFLHDVLDVNRYQRTIFSNEAERTFIFSDPTLSGEKVRRAASIFGSHLDAAFAMLLPLGVVLHRLRRGWTTSTLLAAGLVGAGLALTQTRSALLGGALIALGALRSGQGGSTTRVRLGVGMALGFVVLLPLVADSALAERITGAFTGSDQESAPEHNERSRAAFDAVVDRPLGQGLGSSGGVANRFGVQGHLLPENHYLRVALDVGVLGGLLFIGVVATGARSARRRAARTDSLLDAAAASGLTGLCITGLFLDSFSVISSSVPLLLVVGLATSRVPPPTTPRDDEAEAPDEGYAERPRRASR